MWIYTIIPLKINRNLWRLKGRKLRNMNLLFSEIWIEEIRFVQKFDTIFNRNTLRIT